MKKLGIMLMVLATTLLLFAVVGAGAAADAPPKTCNSQGLPAGCIPPTTTAPPTTTTTTESPGANCSHGVNDDGTCRPDPNEHGQDCDAHGNDNPAGNDGNEDHCLTTTTSTTAPPPPETTTVTTVTEPPVTTTTTTTDETTTTEPPATTTVPTTATTTTSSPTVQPPNNGGGGNGGNEGPAEEQPNPGKLDAPGKLAFTGIEDIVPLGSAALLMLSLGSGLMWAGRRKEDVA